MLTALEALELRLLSKLLAFEASELVRDEAFAAGACVMEDASDWRELVRALGTLARLEESRANSEEALARREDSMSFAGGGRGELAWFVGRGERGDGGGGCW